MPNIALERLIGRENVLVYLPEGETWGDHVILSADNTNFSYSRSMDTTDVTAGNERTRTRVATIEDMTWTARLFAADRSYEGVIMPGQRGDLYILKMGAGGDKPILGFETLINGFNEDMPFDGAIEIDLAGERQGDMEFDVGSRTPAAPTVSSLSPATETETASAVSIEVDGTGFTSNSRAYATIDGVETLLSNTAATTNTATSLFVDLPAGSAAAAGTIPVYVVNYPSLAQSTASTFTVTSA